MKKKDIAIKQKQVLGLLFVMAIALLLPACPPPKVSSKPGDMALRRMDQLAAQNEILEKRITELERKLKLFESYQTNSTPLISVPLPVASNPGANTNLPPYTKPKKVIPPAPNLAVVKIYPTGPINGTGASSPESDLPPPLFGDDSAFEEVYEDNDSSFSYDPETVPSSGAPSNEATGLPVEGATLFESAIGQYHRGNYDLAAEAFMLYVNKYPGTAYEPSSIFHLGECKLKLHKYGEAVEQFRRYLMKYPDGNEAPMSLLQLGLCFLRLEDAASAKKAFRQCVDRYPESVAAEAAQQELKNML